METVTTQSNGAAHKTVRVLIADDHDVVRTGVRLMVENEPDWEVCGEARDGREAVAMAAELAPDVVVLDLTMPELGGIEATRQIKRQSSNVEVVMLTAHTSDQLVHDVFDVGARSYLLKTEAAKYLVDAIRAAAQHKPFFTAKVSEVVFARYLDGRAPERRHQALTPRERELVQLVGEGRTNKEAAALLGISVRTVETHRAAIMRKLALKSVSEVVRYAIQNRIIDA